MRNRKDNVKSRQKKSAGYYEFKDGHFEVRGYMTQKQAMKLMARPYLFKAFKISLVFLFLVAFFLVAFYFKQDIVYIITMLSLQLKPINSILNDWIR